MSHSRAHAPYYFIPEPSAYPILASLGLLGLAIGAVAWVNDQLWGAIVCLLSLAWLIKILFAWFGQSIRESESGLYGQRIDLSYRWSMSWFIFSEVMFFAAFFGALFYARSITMPWLADLDHKILWPDFTAQWPNSGPADLVQNFTVIGPWPLPTINTALLLSSGVTLTLAHHALREDKRSQAIWGLTATVLLGVAFIICQAYEYMHAYHALNLRLDSGVYGSTFFMLTGFHGFHVLMGALMLTVVLFRLCRGHFTAQHHFAFEGAAWYWHFVDIVWLGLYVVVYWL